MLSKLMPTFGKIAIELHFYIDIPTCL